MARAKSSPTSAMPARAPTTRSPPRATRHRLAARGARVLLPPPPGARHAAAEAARARMRTPTGRDAAFDRQAHAQGAIAELKHHGAGPARSRGTRLVQLQLLAAATAINLKPS